jgi:hypothetical protein
VFFAQLHDKAGPKWIFTSKHWLLLADWYSDKDDTCEIQIPFVRDQKSPIWRDVAFYATLTEILEISELLDIP